MGIKHNNADNLNSKKGFTIIETIVVLGIISLIIPSIFAIIFANLRAHKKVTILQEVKTNGDNALSTIEMLTKKYGRSLHSGEPPTDDNKICVTDDYSDGRIYIKDSDNSWFSFYLDEGKIASSSSNFDVPRELTNDNVYVSDFVLTCEARGAFNPSLISVSYTISEANASAIHEEKSTLHYQTKIKLRAYE